MDLYELAIEHLLNLPPLQTWPEANELLRAAGVKHDRNWRLPILGCQAVGGEPLQALPVMAAVAVHQIAIILVDDMLDGDSRGWHHRLGEPLASNLALALQSAAALSILAAEAAPAVKLAALHSLSKMALNVAHGQSQDVRNPSDEAGYWQIIALKSGPFFASALEAGALFGGASPETAEGLYKLGHLIGEMIQLHDDVHDTLAEPASPDWLTGRLPLPILFAQQVPHLERERFMALRGQVAESAALAEAQQILIHCGAVSYCLYRLLDRGQLAREFLSTLPLAEPAPLAALLDELIEPVHGLLAGLY